MEHLGISKSTYLHPSDMEQIQAMQTPRLFKFSAMDPGSENKQDQIHKGSIEQKQKKHKPSLVVVYLPLWKIWQSVGWLFPTEWKNTKCSKAPTINIHLSYGCIVFLVWLVDPDIDQLYQEKKSIWWWPKQLLQRPGENMAFSDLTLPIFMSDNLSISFS